MQRRGPPTEQGEEEEIQPAMLSPPTYLRSSRVFHGRPSWTWGGSRDEAAGLATRKEVESSVLRTGRIRLVPALGGTGPLNEPMHPSGSRPSSGKQAPGSVYTSRQLTISAIPTTAVTLTDITAVPVPHHLPAPAPASASAPHHHRQPSHKTRQQQCSIRLHNY